MELRYQYKQIVRITIKNFEENMCIMIDVTVPTYKNISLKEFQKRSKYKDLEIEVTKMWKLKTKAIPIVMGVLEMTNKGAQILSIKSLVNHHYRKCRKQYSQVLLTYYQKFSQCK